MMVPLPDCASGEWGPTKATRLFGLIPITHQVLNALHIVKYAITRTIYLTIGGFSFCWKSFGVAIQNV